MNKIFSIALFVGILGFSSVSGEDMSFKEFVDSGIEKNHYEPSAWEARGLIQSKPEVVNLLKLETHTFLIGLKKVGLNQELSMEQKSAKVMALTDAISWYDLDTEEREFIADTLVPYIQKLGLDPWVYF